MIYTKFYRIYVVDGIFLQNSCFESIPGQQTEKLLMNFILVDLIKTLYFEKIGSSKKLTSSLGVLYFAMCYTALSINPWSQKSVQKIKKKSVRASHLSPMNKSYLQTFSLLLNLNGE